MNEDTQAIVIDIGSGLCKNGFAGDEGPVSVFPTLVGRPKFLNTNNPNQVMKDTYVGDEAGSKPGLLVCKHPVQHGIVTDWDDIEIVYHHAFFDQLRIDPAGRTVLMTEASLNPSENRKKMTEIMFEKFNVGAFYVASQSALALYTTGQTVGLVITSGEGTTNAVPIYEGCTIKHAIKPLSIAGTELNVWMHKVLQEKGYNIKMMDTIEDIKERFSYVAIDFDSEMMKSQTSTECDVTYNLPDSTSISISIERFRCPELLFKPYFCGYEFDGLEHAISDSILACDPDIQAELAEKIYLAGGSTLFNGLPERIEKEVTRLGTISSPIKVTPCKDRKNAAWIGGSILSSLGSFQQMVITKDEFKECGSSIVNYKCL